MAPLSGQEVLRIWEAGVSLDPVGRALGILARAWAGSSREALADLPVGRRDKGLLAVREETFGATLDGSTSCSSCAERVEFTLQMPELRARLDAGGEEACGEGRIGPWTLRYRLPTSRDLRAVAAQDDLEEAGRALGRRCLLEARRDGVAVAPDEVPAEALSGMAAAMAEQDPLAEVFLDYVCPSCGGAGRVLFDIAAYLWEEIRAEAARLLREVDLLARAYGWRESDILDLSAARRRAYVELAAG